MNHINSKGITIRSSSHNTRGQYMKILFVYLATSVVLTGCVSSPIGPDQQEAHAKKVSSYCKSVATPGTADYSKCMREYDNPEQRQRNEYRVIKEHEAEQARRDEIIRNSLERQQEMLKEQQEAYERSRPKTSTTNCYKIGDQINCTSTQY